MEIFSKTFLFDPKGRFISCYFKYKTVKSRMLKHLYFKMESIKQAIHMIKPKVYLVLCDTKDAFVNHTCKVIEIHVVK